jgi:hypothetical protein
VSSGQGNALSPEKDFEIHTGQEALVAAKSGQKGANKIFVHADNRFTIHSPQCSACVVKFYVYFTII